MASIRQAQDLRNNTWQDGKKRRKAFFFLFFLLATVYQLPTTAHAQGVSLGISPPILQIEAVPPATIEAPITVVNNGQEPLELTIELRAYRPSETGSSGQIRLVTKSEDPDGVYSAIFENTKILFEDQAIKQLSLAPKQQKTLTLSIVTQSYEPAADYYFSVIFLSTAKTDEPVQEPKSIVQGGIATNVLLSVGKKGKVMGVIEAFSGPKFLSKGPVPFEVKLKNTSNHYITPTGKIIITNMFGQAIGKVDLSPANVLAGSSRNLANSADQSLVWDETFLLGMYSAKLSLALSENGPVFIRKMYFFAFPVEAFVGIVLATIIVAHIHSRVKKRRALE